MKGTRISAGLLFLISIFIGLSYAEVPNLINYQGHVTDKGGSPLTGTYDITFNIYATETGGTALWTETHNGSNAIQVKNGLFSVLLGGLTAFPSNLFNEAERWLAIKIESDTEMSPRQKIVSVPYSIAGGSTMPGMIMMWSGAIATIPQGWLLCNGAAISRVDYADLFNAIGTIYGAGDGSTTFNLPNYVNRSPMGANADVGGIPMSNVSGTPAQYGGEAQHTLTENEMPSHTHIQNAHGHSLKLKYNNKNDCQGQTGRTSYTDESGSGLYNDTNILTNTIATNQNAGGGAAHNILDPYFAITYIIYAGN